MNSSDIIYYWLVNKDYTNDAIGRLSLFVSISLSSLVTKQKANIGLVLLMVLIDVTDAWVKDNDDKGTGKGDKDKDINIGSDS
jgi:hypothetical protein